MRECRGVIKLTAGCRSLTPKTYVWGTTCLQLSSVPEGQSAKPCCAKQALSGLLPQRVLRPDILLPHLHLPCQSQKLGSPFLGSAPLSSG